MKARKTENRFSTIKIRFAKTSISIPNCNNGQLLQVRSEWRLLTEESESFGEGQAKSSVSHELNDDVTRFYGSRTKW